MIRRLCAHMGSEKVYSELASILEEEQDMEFAAVMVQVGGGLSGSSGGHLQSCGGVCAGALGAGATLLQLQLCARATVAVPVMRWPAARCIMYSMCSQQELALQSGHACVPTSHLPHLSLPLPQALHLILVTSSEVSDLRQALRDIQEEPSGAGSRVFKALYSCWCHSAGG